MIVAGERFLTVAEAAEWFQVSENTIRSWRNRRGDVRAIRYGGRLILSATDLARAERDTRGKYLAQRERSALRSG